VDAKRSVMTPKFAKQVAQFRRQAGELRFEVVFQDFGPR
jgi:hypothetical protein